jgi:hypothetical protein
MENMNGKSSDKYCITCTLPESFPGIWFDDRGVCNFCLDFEGIESQESRKLDYKLRFETLIKKYRGQSSYDTLMCYSGGKDSTYTLALLREKYQLNVLAVSFDNGFLPEQTLLNIHNVVEELGVDHIMVKPRFDVLARIFQYCADNDVYPPKALERSSAICTSCMGIIKYSALRIAIEKEIPFISYGWSPGQVPISSSVLMNNPQMVQMMQKALFNPLFGIVGDDIKPYFLEEKHFGGPIHFPYNINPLAFLDYNLEVIYQDIKKLGWKRPENVDANSTNCLLNSFGNYIHKRHFGFHPYALELASLVRSGYLPRETAIARLREEEDPHIVQMVKEKIMRGMNQAYK